ncbi:MAG: alpha/beta hydrolase [Acidimicrobiales bacterium]
MSVVETCVVPSPTGELLVDVFRPTSTGNRCGIIFFHGGGWRALSREVMHVYAQPMAELGFVGLAADYRLLGEAPWPAQIHDVKRFIRWARTNADQLGIDPERIVLWGASAGAHLSLLAAGTPSDAFGDDSNDPDAASDDVAAVIALFPPTGFHHGEPTERYLASGNTLLGEGYDAPAAHRASPISHVGPDFPPTLLLHGTDDHIVSHRHSEVMFEALREAGASVDLHLFHGHDHEFVAIPSVLRRVAAEAAYFIDRFVIDPEQHRAEAEEFSLFARRAAEERRRHQ